MADRIIKPDTGNDLILQNDDASAKLEINEDGTVAVTGNASISGDLQVTGNDIKDSGGNAALTFDGSANTSFNDKNITNVGDIALDTISSDTGGSVDITLGSDSGDDFNVAGKLLVEGDTGRVGIGTGTPSTELHIVSASAGQPVLHLECTNAGTSGANIKFDLDTSSPADADVLGQVLFEGKNDNDEAVSYGEITMKSADVSDGTEDVTVEIKGKYNGSDVTFLKFDDKRPYINTIHGETYGNHQIWVVSATGQLVYDTSTKRAKKEIKSSDLKTEDILKFKLKKYKANNDDSGEWLQGLIAEDVAEINLEFVNLGYWDDEKNESIGGYADNPSLIEGKTKTPVNIKDKIIVYSLVMELQKLEKRVKELEK